MSGMKLAYLPANERPRSDPNSHDWRQMLSRVLYGIRKGPERRFTTPSCQRLNITSSCITVIQSYSHTVVGDASVSLVNWLWDPVSPFEGKFQSIFIQMPSSSRTLG